MLRLPEVVLPLPLDPPPRLYNLRHLMPLIPSPVTQRRDLSLRGWADASAFLLHVARFPRTRSPRLIFHFPGTALPRVVAAGPCAACA